MTTTLLGKSEDPVFTMHLSLLIGELDRDYEKLYPIIRQDELDEDIEDLERMTDEDEISGQSEEEVSDYDETTSEEEDDDDDAVDAVSPQSTRQGSSPSLS